MQWTDDEFIGYAYRGTYMMDSLTDFTRRPVFGFGKVLRFFRYFWRWWAWKEFIVLLFLVDNFDVIFSSPKGMYQTAKIHFD